MKIVERVCRYAVIIALSIVLLITLVGKCMGQGGTVRTGSIQIKSTVSPFAADGAVVLDRQDNDMRFTGGGQTILLNDLLAASATSRTAIVDSTSIQGATMVFAGASNVHFSDGTGGSNAGRSVFGAYSNQIHDLTLDNPILWGTDTFNEGISGEDSADGVARFDDIMNYPGSRSGNDPDIVVIVYGGNDLGLGGNPVIPVAQFISNISAMTTDAKSSGTTPILINIADIGFGSFVTGPGDQNELSDAIRNYNNALKLHAEQNEILLFDQNELMGEARHGDEPNNPLFVDQSGGGSIHFSLAGQRRMAVEFANFLYDHGILPSRGHATRVEFLPFNSAQFTLTNQDNLTASSNETLTISDTDTIVEVDYRLMRSEAAAGDLSVFTHTFKGTGIGIVAGTGEMGIIDVSIDGGADEAVDLYSVSARQTISDVVWYSRNLDFSSDHTIQVQLKDTKNAASGAYEFWFMGLVVERGATNYNPLHDFHTTVTVPALIVQNIDTSDDVSANLTEFTGDNSLSPFQGNLWTDLNMKLARTGSPNMFEFDTENRLIGFNVPVTSDIQRDFHVVVDDSFMLRSISGSVPPQDSRFPFLITRNEYSDKDIDSGITWAESVGGELTDTEMASLAMEVIDATPGSVDTRLIFSVAVDDELAPVVYHDDTGTSILQPLWIRGTATGLDLSTLEPSHFVVDHDDQNIGYLIGANNNFTGWSFGDSDSSLRGAVIYDHAKDELLTYWLGGAHMFGDSFGTTITMGSPGAGGSVIDSDTVLLIEDDKNCFIQISSTSETQVGIIFSDDASGSRGSIIVDIVNNMSILCEGDMTIEGDTGLVRVNAADGTEIVLNDRGFDVNTRIESDNNANAFFVQGSDGFVGVGTSAPGSLLEAAASATNADIAAVSYAVGTGFPLIRLRKSDSNTIGAKAQTDDGDTIGAVSWQGVDTSLAFDNGASIVVTQNGAAGTKVPTDMVLSTYNSTAQNVDQLVLSTTGNVGVGTNDPKKPLHVVLGAGTVPSLFSSHIAVFQNNSTTADIARIGFIGKNDGLSVLDFGDDEDADAGGINYSHVLNSFSFRTNGTGDRLIIDADGRVGINITPTVSLFQVSANEDAAAVTIANDGNDPGRIGIDIACGDNNATVNGDATHIRFFDGDGTGGSGSITMEDGNMALNDPSDKILKKNIRKTKINHRRIIRDLRVVDFEWKSSDSGTTQTGVIAQEVEAVMPRAVTTVAASIRGTSYTETTWTPTTKTIIVSLADGTTGTTSVVEMTSQTVTLYHPPERLKAVNRLAFIMPLLAETQRQQKEIDYLWAVVATLFTAVIALATYQRHIIKVVRKLAKGEAVSQEDIDLLKAPSMKDITELKQALAEMKAEKKE